MTVQQQQRTKTEVVMKHYPGTTDGRPSVAVERMMTPTEVRFAELKEEATIAFMSGLLPRSVDTVEKAITIAMMGRELNIPVMASLCGIYVLNGMPALRGSLMLRLIYERAPGCGLAILTAPEQADRECVVEMKRPNGPAQRFRYSVEDARKAGFMNKPTWQQHTSTMLRWAAIRTGARIVFADALAGCPYMGDEIPGADDHDVVEEPKLVTAVAPPAPEPVAKQEEKPAPVAATLPGPGVPPSGALPLPKREPLKEPTGFVTPERLSVLQSMTRKKVPEDMVEATLLELAKNKPLADLTFEEFNRVITAVGKMPSLDQRGGSPRAPMGRHR
jgi:hypothetical protein